MEDASFFNLSKTWDLETLKWRITEGWITHHVFLRENKLLHLSRPNGEKLKQ